MRSAIGLDIGGTKMAGYRVDDAGAILERTQRPTPGEPEDILAAMGEMCRQLVSSDVSAVGIGAAGMIEVATGILRYAPNLPWRDLPLAERIRSATGLPCLVDNDANAAAWGEFRFGAGR